MFKRFGGPFDSYLGDNIYGEQTNARLYKAAAMVSIFSQDLMIKCFAGPFDPHLTDNIFENKRMPGLTKQLRWCQYFLKI